MSVYTKDDKGNLVLVTRGQTQAELVATVQEGKRLAGETPSDCLKDNLKLTQEQDNING